MAQEELASHLEHVRAREKELELLEMFNAAAEDVAQNDIEERESLLGGFAGGADRDSRRDLRLADKDWQPRPHWVETDQIVTVDAKHRALRHLATLVDADKLLAVDDSIRMMLNL